MKSYSKAFLILVGIIILAALIASLLFLRTYGPLSFVIIVALIAAIGWIIIGVFSQMHDATSLLENLFFRKNKESLDKEPVIEMKEPVRVSSLLGIASDRLQRALTHSPADHSRVFGVDNFISNLGEHLSNPDDDWTISVWGDGGVGKTTVVHEVLKRYAIKSGFTHFAWVSAIPRKEFGMSGRNLTQLHDVIDKAAQQLGFHRAFGDVDLIHDFSQNLSSLPPGEKVLIVIDNLEGVKDPELLQELVSPARSIVNPHKIIITTRHQAQPFVTTPGLFEVRQEGLSLQNTLDFVRYLGRTSSDIQASEDTKLLPIYRITEGNPYLIKIIVTRFLETHVSFEKVLAELVELEEPTGLSESVRQALYRPSLDYFVDEVGEDVASAMLMSFCFSGDLIDYETLKKRSNIVNEVEFRHGLELGVRLSLVRASEFNTRYSIHSLLKEFICLDQNE